MSRSNLEGALRVVVKTFCHIVLYFVPPDGAEDHLSISKKILISIDLVITPLNDMLSQFEGLSGRWAYKRMVMRGWCPLETLSILRHKPFYVKHFIPSVASPRWGLDHRNCTEHACRGRFIGGIYRTKHRSEDCACDFVFFPETLFDMVQQHRIPVVSSSSGTGLHVSAHNPDVPKNFVAISHVYVYICICDPLHSFIFL